MEATRPIPIPHNQTTRLTPTFRTKADVWAYLSSTIFYGRCTRFRITPQCMEVDGSPATGGVRVTNFGGSRATLQASSPYIGGQTVTLYVTASNGSISSGGEVFIQSNKHQRVGFGLLFAFLLRQSLIDLCYQFLTSKT